MGQRRNSKCNLILGSTHDDELIVCKRTATVRVRPGAWACDRCGPRWRRDDALYDIAVRLYTFAEMAKPLIQKRFDLWLGERVEEGTYDVPRTILDAVRDVFREQVLPVTRGASRAPEEKIVIHQLRQSLKWARVAGGVAPARTLGSAAAGQPHACGPETGNANPRNRMPLV